MLCQIFGLSDRIVTAQVVRTGAHYTVSAGEPPRDEFAVRHVAGSHCDVEAFSQKSTLR